VPLLPDACSSIVPPHARRVECPWPKIIVVDPHLYAN
jgi:hypothetical protein